MHQFVHFLNQFMGKMALFMYRKWLFEKKCPIIGSPPPFPLGLLHSCPQWGVTYFFRHGQSQPRLIRLHTATTYFIRYIVVSMSRVPTVCPNKSPLLLSCFCLEGIRLPCQLDKSGNVSGMDGPPHWSKQLLSVNVIHGAQRMNSNGIPINFSSTFSIWQI